MSRLACVPIKSNQTSSVHVFVRLPILLQRLVDRAQLLDAEPRVVDPPPDLAVALAQRDLVKQVGGESLPSTVIVDQAISHHRSIGHEHIATQDVGSMSSDTNLPATSSGPRQALRRLSCESAKVVGVSEDRLDRVEFGRDDLGSNAVLGEAGPSFRFVVGGAIPLLVELQDMRQSEVELHSLWIAASTKQDALDHPITALSTSSDAAGAGTAIPRRW